MKHARARKYLFAIVAIAAAAQAGASELVVRVSGLSSSSGEVGCALFKVADGFPMNPAGATQQWMTAAAKGVECRFAGIASGDYAVSVSHDLNGNRALDTNFFGVPTEAWGVSNNARPLMRVPAWKEAVFSVAEGKDLAIDIKVSK
jgi:uncharacterized protein (DUF2141 family)